MKTSCPALTPLTFSLPIVLQIYKDWYALNQLKKQIFITIRKREETQRERVEEGKNRRCDCKGDEECEVEVINGKGSLSTREVSGGVKREVSRQWHGEEQISQEKRGGRVKKEQVEGVESCKETTGEHKPK